MERKKVSSIKWSLFLHLAVALILSTSCSVIVNTLASHVEDAILLKSVDNISEYYEIYNEYSNNIREYIEHDKKLPEGWAICKMKQITSITNGKSQKNVETLNGIYPIYGSGGVIGRANQYLCIAGSTIIGRKGTINNPIFVEEHFWNVDTAFGLKANDAILDKYLYYFCLSFDFSKLDKSTAMPSLTKTSIGNVLIPIPPYIEQERIVAKIDMVLDTMNEILRAV